MDNAVAEDVMAKVIMDNDALDVTIVEVQKAVMKLSRTCTWHVYI